MNRILYALIGVCLVAVIVSTFMAKVDIAKLSTTDFAVSIGFLVSFCAGGLAWSASPWSKQVKARFDAGEDRVRIKARDEGKVRRPPWWSFWP